MASDKHQETRPIPRIKASGSRLSSKPLPRYGIGSRASDHQGRKVLESDRSARSVKRRIQKAYAKRIQRRRTAILIALVILITLVFLILSSLSSTS